MKLKYLQILKNLSTICSLLLLGACAHNFEGQVGWISKESDSSKLIKKLSGSDPVQVFFPANQYGPAKSGLSFDFPIPGDVNYELQYDILFAEDFDFNKGGKLPGLCGGMYRKVSATNRRAFDQWEFDDGFSLRAEWRERGQLVGFLFFPNQETSEGEDFSFLWKKNQIVVPRGKWFTVMIRAQLNDPLKPNGQVDFFINDLLVASPNQLRLRSEKGAKIDRLCFSAFFEGDSPAWAPKHDQRLWIKNLKVKAL